MLDLKKQDAFKGSVLFYVIMILLFGKEGHMDL